MSYYNRYQQSYRNYSSILSMEPFDIGFTQDSICYRFMNGGYVNATITKIENNQMKASDFPTISVFQQNGKYFSKDNRRLYVFRVLQCRGKLDKVDVNITTFNPYRDARKFTTKNQGQSIFVRQGATHPHTRAEVVQKAAPQAKMHITVTRPKTAASTVFERIRPSEILFTTRVITEKLHSAVNYWFTKITSGERTLEDLRRKNRYPKVIKSTSLRRKYFCISPGYLYLLRALEYMGIVERVIVRIISHDYEFTENSSDQVYYKNSVGEFHPLQHNYKIASISVRNQLRNRYT